MITVYLNDGRHTTVKNAVEIKAQRDIGDNFFYVLQDQQGETAAKFLVNVVIGWVIDDSPDQRSKFGVA